MLMSLERAALVQSYLADRQEPDKPDRLSRLGLLTAAEMYRRDEIDIICITVVPELSEAQVQRLQALLRNPPEGVIVSAEETVTTRGEIRTFKRLAEENGWDSLVTIANQAHVPRTRREIVEEFRNVPVNTITPEQKLKEYPRYEPVLDAMTTWPEQISLEKQEKILNNPLVGPLLLKAAEYFADFKVFLQTSMLKKIEGQG